MAITAECKLQPSPLDAIGSTFEHLRATLDGSWCGGYYYHNYRKGHPWIGKLVHNYRQSSTYGGYIIYIYIYVYTCVLKGDYKPSHNLGGLSRGRSLRLLPVLLLL